MYSCWCCDQLRKRYDYKGCPVFDKTPETKALLNQMLETVKSPGARDTVLKG
jgi:hypothetical protein